MVTFAGLLHSHREHLNRLNVFPVPDGDTGTNMDLTVASVVDALAPMSEESTMDEVCAAIARGSLMGARGNSGVILSQMLRGMTDRFRSVVSISPAVLADSLAQADRLARQAVVRPVEGTILTVARAAAQGANAAKSSMSTLVHGARERAREALARTPDQLAVLKEAGVVDSGGSGLVLLFDALCHVTCDDPLPSPPDAEDTASASASARSTFAGANSPRYEVMYLLEGADEGLDAFRENWTTMGDSIVIVGGDGLYNCHIHTDHIGPAIEAALDMGRPRSIRVTDLEDESAIAHHDVTPPGATSDAVVATAAVAVVAGNGLERIFRSLGVAALVAGGQSMNPSAAELLAAIAECSAREVVVLPNNANVVLVARQAAEIATVPVRVVPTHAVVEGLSALVAFNPEASAEANVEAMAHAAQRVRAGEVTRAVRDATTEVGTVHQGDWLAVRRGHVTAVADSMQSACLAIVDQLLDDDSELVTVVEGVGALAGVTEAIEAAVAARVPSAEVEVHRGGQPTYPYYIGVE